MPNLQCLIIGAVATGTKTASRLKRLDPNAEITLIDENDIISYGACTMPYYLEGIFNDFEDLYGGKEKPRDEKYFNEKGIYARTNIRAEKIDRLKKEVLVYDKMKGVRESINYDKLVLATGASAFVPPIEGKDLKRVYTFTEPKSAREIKTLLDKKKLENVSVVGAGLIGVEIAEAIRLCGVNVSLIELDKTVLPKMFDEEISETISEHLVEKGINIKTETKLLSIKGNAKGEAAVCVTDKGEIKTDAVILALGVRPNSTLAKDAGLQVNENDCIHVNEYMQTSDENIFAGGDVVDNPNVVTGGRSYTPMGDLANIHGRLIADNIFGLEKAFKGVVGTGITRAFDLNLARTGLSEKEARMKGFDPISVNVKGYDKVHLMKDAKTISVKLTADRESGKILGGQIIGEGDVAKRVNTLAMGLYEGITVSDLTMRDLAYAPPYSPTLDNLITAANVLDKEIYKLSKSFSAERVTNNVLNRLKDELNF